MSSKRTRADEGRGTREWRSRAVGRQRQLVMKELGGRVSFRKEEKINGKTEEGNIRKEVEEQLKKEVRKLNEKLSEIRNMFMKYMEERNVKIRK